MTREEQRDRTIGIAKERILKLLKKISSTTFKDIVYERNLVGSIYSCSFEKGLVKTIDSSSMVEQALNELVKGGIIEITKTEVKLT